MNLKFIQTKSRVNPILQTIIAMILCMLSTIALITWIVIADSGVLDINTAFLMERFVIYASLPLLILVPFSKMGKIIKIIPGVIGTSVGSMTFIFVIFPVMLILPVIVSSLSVIFIGYYINK